MYDEETARKMLKAVSHVFDADGKEGFQPDDAALDDVYHDRKEDDANVTPLIYFAERGDLQMCRYLISRGASTTKDVSYNPYLRYSPMHVSYYNSPMRVATFNDDLSLFKLLYYNGAKHQLRTGGSHVTPFQWLAGEGRDEMVRWLVLHGALCADDDSEDFVGDMIHNQIFHNLDRNIYRTCQRLVDWSEDVLQAHLSVITFLLGSLPDNDRGCILQCLSGHPGILKQIGDYVGLEVTKAKRLRIVSFSLSWRCFLKR